MRTRWFRSLGVASAFVLVAGSAHAAGSLFSPLDLAASNVKSLNVDASYSAIVDAPTTASFRMVNANAGLVTTSLDSLDLNLEPGLELRAHRVDSYVTKSGALVWSGVIEDPASVGVPFSPESFQFDPVNTVIMVRNGDKITGNVKFSGQWYKIRPVRSGGHAVIAVNLAAMPPDHPAEYSRIPTVPMPARPAQTKANTVIRVMVNWTSAAAAASGDISSLVDLAVAESNQGYANSGVMIDMVLANKAAVTYTESGNFSTDLTRYRNTADGYMDSIHTTRNSVTADVGLLVINNGSACGLASGIGSTASTAFAAAYWDCITGYYSFAHEIGHLQSARHDPATDPSTSPYTYGHGYRKTTTPRWRTIMAYDCPTGCTRLNYWSNPSVLYNGAPMGTAAQSDNERVLNNTRATVAAFR